MKYLTLVLFVVLSSCVVHNFEIEECKKICSKNDGIDCIQEDLTSTICYCKNGVRYTLNAKRGQN